MNRRTSLAFVAATATAALALAGCAADAEDPVVPESLDGFAAEHYTTDLTGVCPSTVVIQNNWWPQPDQGWQYQLIGEGGKIDAEHFAYSGPLGSTGVALEIRSGGPATGWTLPPQQLFLDDSILLGITTTEDNIVNSAERPLTAVFTATVTNPLALIWGTDEWDFDSIEDVRDSGETVAVFDGSPWVDYLVAKGQLDPEQLDGSYDGDLSRFVASEGRIIQQGFATSEVYKLQNEVDAWTGPVNYLLLGEDYTSYNSQVSIRTDRLEENADCLEKLVPLLQQASVDYANDPAATNATLAGVVEGFEGSGWGLSEGEIKWATKTSVDLGIVANSPDGALGSFDLDRVQDFIDGYVPVLTGRGTSVPEGLSAEDIVTNRFIDPTIAR
jgi:hypothetical protein